MPSHTDPAAVRREQRGIEQGSLDQPITPGTSQAAREYGGKTSTVLSSILGREASPEIRSLWLTNDLPLTESWGRNALAVCSQPIRAATIAGIQFGEAYKSLKGAPQ